MELPILFVYPGQPDRTRRVGTLSLETCRQHLGLELSSPSYELGGSVRIGVKGPVPDYAGPDYAFAEIDNTASVALGMPPGRYQMTAHPKDVWPYLMRCVSPG